MLENGVIKRLISAASIMGCMVLGALVVNFVTMKCGISIPGRGKLPCRSSYLTPFFQVCFRCY
ncbi:MAG: PTS system mannose/fructose/sorbose family transporter subunit IID [[Clostridium] innocuum]